MENQFCIGVYTLQSLCTQKSKLHTKIGEKWRKKNKKKKRADPCFCCLIFSLELSCQLFQIQDVIMVHSE